MAVPVYRKVHLEILRIVAVLFVIFNHTDGYYLYYSNTSNPLTWLFSALGSVICRTNVPLFLMITGALLLDRKETVKEIYRKRVFWIAVVLFTFSAFYYGVSIIRHKNTGYSVMDFLMGFLEGSVQESFWYLYLYLGILMLLPFFRKLAQNLEDREFGYLILLQLFWSVGVPIAGKATGVEISSYLYQVNIYFFYVMAGYFLEVRIPAEKVTGRHIAAMIGCIAFGLAVAVGIIAWDYFRSGKYDPFCIGILTPVFSLGIFFCIRWIFTGYFLPRRAEALVLYIGNCVFGIYLLEQLARIQLLPLYLYLTEKTVGIFACTCYVIGGFSLALLYTVVLKHVPGIRKLL